MDKEKYCETCLAKKIAFNPFACNPAEDIETGITLKVLLHRPGKQDEVWAHCSCWTEARQYGDYLDRAIWVGVKQAKG